MPQKFIAALDQGTTSTRFIIFDQNCRIQAVSQKEHKQIYPQSGWVEHNPQEIIQNTWACIKEALQKASLKPGQLAGIGITNQRETSLLFNRISGKSYGNALVWQDTRSRNYIRQIREQGLSEKIQQKTGLLPSTYFSASKLRWILDNHPQAKKDAKKGEVGFATMDSWLIWNLSGGAEGGKEITDPTNAGRSLFYNIDKLEWDEELLDIFNLPQSILPSVSPSIPARPYAHTSKNSPLAAEVPLCGILGDQQAALVGQCCFNPGDMKNTYGTGCFILMNTGQELRFSSKGLISTVAYQIEGQKARYAFEGSVAVAGALVQWLRDNLGIISSSSEIEKLAASVKDNGGLYFVPAFSGLFAPHWDDKARGTLIGLTGHSSKAHIARAALEASAFQSREIMDLMQEEGRQKINQLKVDGGMTANNLLMQFQADILGFKVIRPAITETTALGAACAAGISSGIWSSFEDFRKLWQEDDSWEARISPYEREKLFKQWKRAVQRAASWLE